MKTLRFSIDPQKLDSSDAQRVIEEAASILRGGGLVAFPTETVYGLGANALRADAVAKIFEAKQRPSWDPVIVHISDLSMLAEVASFQRPNSCAERLIATHWPGPLTLLLPRSASVPDIVTAGRPLVGVRMPAHAVAHALIAAAGVPIAAPSANSFGCVSPTAAAHVLEDLDGRIDAIVDAGETTHGLESTVVDASVDPVVLYRPGIVALEDIQRICGAARAWIAPEPSAGFIAGARESLPAPGVGIRHYAPRARLILIDGQPSEQAARLVASAQEAGRRQLRAGVMLPTRFLPSGGEEFSAKTMIFEWGNWEDAQELAHRLFAGLRKLDAAGVDLILCPLPPSAGLGAALRDRLMKAGKREA